MRGRSFAINSLSMLRPQLGLQVQTSLFLFCTFNNKTLVHKYNGRKVNAPVLSFALLLSYISTYSHTFDTNITSELIRYSMMIHVASAHLAGSIITLKTLKHLSALCLKFRTLFNRNMNINLPESVITLKVICGVLQCI